MINVSFLGDISLNDNYIDFYENNIDPFNSLKSILFENDFVVGNLECIAKGAYGENELKKPRLKTTLETLNYLKNINLKVVCLAQNHIYDHLEDGFLKTVKFLDDNKIKYLGASINESKTSEPLIIKHNNITLGLINYVTNDTNPNMPVDSKIFLNIFNVEQAILEIKRLKEKVNHVVLLLHWGGRVEGGLYPDFDQPTIAKRLIDEGADLIIGHHSHTVQTYEIYNEKYIFYSLGNFCFSDYTFENKFVPMARRRKITSILTINFEEKTYNPNLSFFLNKGSEFIPLPLYKYNLKIKNIVFKYLLKYKVFWTIYFFNKQKILPVYLFLIRRDLGVFEKMRRLITSFIKIG